MYIRRDSLTRNVYVKPHGLFLIEVDQVLKLDKPFYGLTDAEYYWAKVFNAHVTGTKEVYLNMSPTAGY